MAMVVLDSGNTDAIIKDATGSPDEPLKEIPSAKPAESTEKPVEAKKDEPAPEDDADDIEGEDGLTARQKREFTASMLKTLSRKHRAQKTAEDFATQQYNERQLAIQRADQLARELERMKSELQNAKPKEPEGQAPKRENFETEQAYQDAMLDWKVDQKFRAKLAEDAKKAEEVRQAEILATAKARIDKAIALQPDFKEVTEAADLEVPNHIAGYMQESELFGEIAYHFAKHPDELTRLAKLTPARSLVELGKIESKLTPFAESAAAEPSAKVNGQKPKPSETGSDESPAAASEKATGPSTETVSGKPAGPSRPRPPAPITPLSVGSAAQVEKPESEMNGKEALAHYQKTHGVNLHRRQRH